MDSSFHFNFSNSSTYRIAGYHRKVSHTIRPLRLPFRVFRIAFAASSAAIIITIGGNASLRRCFAREPRAQSATAANTRFAPDSRTLFAPIVCLAPPGPARASRAIAIFDRQSKFQRKISFHPKLGPSLQHVVDLAAASTIDIDPRRRTLLEARNSVARQARRHASDLRRRTTRRRRLSLYTVQEWRSPEEPARFSGVFGLKPAADSTPDNVSSVTGTLAGELMIDTYGLGALVDMLADTLREFHGDLKPPWNTAPGKFDHHDRAAMDSFHRQMPHLAAKFDHYFKFNNLLDEFNSPSGPVVLFNADTEVRLDALKKYPLLYDFYRKLVPAVSAKSEILDTHGNYWMREAFDHGHIHFTIMLRNGLLTPFNAAMQPAATVSRSMKSRAAVTARSRRGK